MIDTCEVTSTPVLEELDGVRAYWANGRLGAHGRGIRVVCLPAADGDWSPIQRGDRVLVGVGAGVAYVLRVYVTHTDEPEVGELHRYLHPGARRDSGAASKSDGVAAVRIGRRAGNDWEEVMLHSTASKEILRLKDMIDAVVSSAEASLDADVKAFGTAAKIAVADKGTITGGAAAKGLEGRTVGGSKS